MFSETGTIFFAIKRYFEISGFEILRVDGIIVTINWRHKLPCNSMVIVHLSLRIFSSLPIRR